jgi:hypothetical protein
MRPTLAATALLVLGCNLPTPAVSVAPEVTFAAHHAHGGLVIDRLDATRTGRLRVQGWFPRPGRPPFVLESGGLAIAALWLPAPGEAVVRQGPAPDAVLIATVRASWDDGAIRLTLQPTGGPVLRTDPLARVGGGTGPATLSRLAQSVLDVRGTYRADIRDSAGGSVGWLRLRVGPYQDAARIVDGVLPPVIGPGLATATALVLDREIDWIEAHAVDVYQGDAGGALHQAFPVSR